MIARRRLALIPALAAAFFILTTLPAFACACCTYPTQRLDALQKMSSTRISDMERLRFAREAKLLLEAHDNHLPGLPEPDENWSLAVTPQKGRLLFSLRDKKGNHGTLTFVLPTIFTVFMADTREAEDKGFGPPLYTEWRLATAFRGTGIFRVAAGENPDMRLIIQGRGNACTTTDAFTHWMLSFGPYYSIVFFGAFDAPAKP